MKITINSCAEETLSRGTSAAIPFVLGIAMGCVITLGVCLLKMDWIENVVTPNKVVLAEWSCIFWGVVPFVMFIASILVLVWLYYRFMVQNGKNIVALEKARYEIVKETLEFTTSKIAIADGKIVIGDKIVFVQDNLEGGKDASTNQTVPKAATSPFDAYEITFSDSALSSTCN